MENCNTSVWMVWHLICQFLHCVASSCT